ncbi:serine/threonine-protein kinase [Actinomadura chokoriensis]|uniref:Serine/threonine-protein kinase n=1 Tax=Actinomadura chokoriensis TaxID=454156 RepID=A0ABV4R3A6_9ACTN
MEPVRDGDPRQIGPYRLIGHLGTGGMGRVFLGRSRGGRAVAVKLVHADLAGDAEFRRRFADEVAAARRVGGFYTAQVVDADTGGDPPWLATAYIPGPSLAEAVTAHGPLPATAVRVLGAGLAEGLAAIHASGLIHRDLTHRNVILADDGPRVIDFGIAKALDTVHSSTRVIGTPGFMSPEQARADPVGPESDVFSLGCVLTYAAAGTGPFGTGRADLIIYRIVHEEPRLDGVPADIAPLLRSCLAKHPADRPALNDVLDRLAPPEHDGTAAAWLPPDITTMITERGTAVGAPPRPGVPEAPEPAGARTGGSRPRRTAYEAEPLDGPPGTRPVPQLQRPTGPAEVSERPAARTASAAMAMLCLLTELVIPFAAVQAFDAGALSAGSARVHVALCVVQALVLATGAFLLLFLRKAAGRRLIAAGSAAVTLQAVYALVSFRTVISQSAAGLLTLTAAAAAAAALVAVLPSTGRPGRRRS